MIAFSNFGKINWKQIFISNVQNIFLKLKYDFGAEKMTKKFTTKQIWLRTIKGDLTEKLPSMKSIRKNSSSFWTTVLPH